MSRLFVWAAKDLSKAGQAKNLHPAVFDFHIGF